MLIRKTTLYKKLERTILNQQIEELKQLEAQIRDEETKLDEYQRLIDEKDKSERHLSHLKENLKQLSKMHENKQKQLGLHAHAQE